MTNGERADRQEIVVSDSEAREAVDGAESVLVFGRDLLVRLRRP